MSERSFETEGGMQGTRREYAIDAETALNEIWSRIDRLKGALAATRRVTDEGWLPRQTQVGLTGRVIKPRLYIGVGVRGAPNHIVGIRHAGTIVALNRDPKSPIFEHADIGLVGDWRELLPALAEALAAAAG